MLNSVESANDSIPEAGYRAGVGWDWMLVVDKVNWSWVGFNEELMIIIGAF